MAPEIIACQSYGTQADMYSFGLLLYAMITGETPFKGFSSLQIIHAVVQQRERPKFSTNGSIPAAVKELIHRCWANEPASRPSAEAALSIVDTLEIEDPVEVCVI